MFFFVRRHLLVGFGKKEAGLLLFLWGGEGTTDNLLFV